MDETAEPQDRGALAAEQYAMSARSQGCDPTGVSPARQQRNEDRREQQTEPTGNEHSAEHDEHDVAISAERSETGWQQQDDKSQCDRQPCSDGSVDDHAHDRVAPFAAEANDEPGTHAVSRQDRKSVG